jgi:hypothetical protein
MTHHRRVEGQGSIRWYYGDKLLQKVTTAAFYRDGHVHPEDCACDALVHDEKFWVDLKKAQAEAEAE